MSASDHDEDDLRSRFGSARHPERESARPRTGAADDATVEALGKLSEALEVVEQARGALYEFHRLTGMADLTLGEAVRMLCSAGHPELAEEIDEALVGRDVVPGHWSFQLIDEYNAGYWQVFRAAEARAREVTGCGERHIFEAEMKVDEQRNGVPS